MSGNPKDNDGGGADRVHHAQSYPFDLQADGFIWRNGALDPFDPDACTGKTAMLAIGSNGAPSRLAAKLAHTGGVVAVAPAILHDYAVVFAGHVTAYGSVPATAVAYPGARAQIAVIWADQTAFERIRATEGLGTNYRVERLDVPITCPALAIEGEIDAFLSLSGELSLGGRPVRLAEVPTVRTDLPAMMQPAVLRLLHRQFGGERSFEAFIDELISSPELRAGIREQLTRDLRPDR